jgi:hypothetical protein
MAGQMIATLNERPPGLMMTDSCTDGHQLAEKIRDDDSVRDWFGIHHQRVYLYTFYFEVINLIHSNQISRIAVVANLF